MSSVVAIVKSIVGQVFAVSPEGVRRVLIEGDRLLVGDQVDTGAAGAVTLELADGQTLDLGRDTQWSGSAPDSSSGLAEATAQAAPSVEELQQAIVAGADPTKDLEATAAGPTAAGTGGAAGGGHSFVMLDATAGRVAPTVGFPTDGPDFTATTTTLDTGSNQNTTVTNAPSVLTADTGTQAEDSVATGNVLNNDSDADTPLGVASFTVAGMTGSFTAGQTAAIVGVGTLTIGTNGNYTFTPDANYNGAVPQVTYTTNTGLTSTLDLTVTAVDDPSVLTADTQTIAEDTPAIGNVLSNDSDIDNVLSVATFTIAGVNATFTAGQTATIANVGTLVIAADGAYTFTPAANYNGTVPTVSYTVTDGSGTDVTSTLNISVTPVDDSFTDASETVTTSEDSPVTGSVLNGTSSVDGPVSVVNFTVGGTQYQAGETATITNVGTLVLAADGAYTFTPAANYNGTVPTVSYTVTDGSGSNVTSTLNISVTPVDDSFTDLSEIVTTSEDAPVTGSVLAGTSSVDGPVSVVNFTIGASTYAAGATATIANVGTLVLAADGAYTFTPAANYNGTVPTVGYTVTDGSGTDVTSTLNISVTPVDDSFTDLNETVTTSEDSPVTGSVLDGTSSVDGPVSVLNFTIGVTTYAAGDTATIANVGTLVIGANGAYTFTPAANYNGTVPTVSYTVTDGSGSNVTSTLNISVTPVDDSFTDLNETVTTSEDSPVTGSVLSGTSSVDGPVSMVNFTIGETTYAAGSTATIANVGTLVLAADGAYTFTPAANYNGTVPSVTYTVTDGSGSNVTSTLNISVTPVEDSFTDLSEIVTTSEDAPVTGSVLSGTSSVDGPVSVVNFTIGETTYAAGSTATIANVGTLVLAADGAYTFTPAANYNGTVPSVSYTVTDGSGTDVTSTLNISVTPVDDSFTDLNETVSTLEDTAVTGSVLDGTSSVDGPVSVLNFTIGASTYAAGATATIANVGTLVIAADGAYTFTPAANYNGTVPTVSYTITDGSGTDVTSTLNISVTPVDDSFTDLNETVSTLEDTALTGSVLDGTSSGDGPVSVLNFTVGGTQYLAGETATITNVGALMIGASGAYTFTPAANYNGTVPTVSYTVTDGSGGNDTSTLNISVTPVDDSFTDASETASTLEDTAVTGSVLDGTSSGDGPVSVLNFTVGGTQYLAGETATITNVGALMIGASGAYTFTPAANYNGSVPSVTYTVTDGSGTNDTSTLNISVTPVNDPSVLTADTNTVDEDHAATGNVLSNDHDVDNLLSVATFTVGGTEYAAGVPAIIANVGTLVIGANGAYTFTPDSNYNGTVPTVTYTTNTGSTSTLNISVTAVDDPSVLGADTQTVDEDHVATGNVLTNDSDVDNDLSVATFTVGGTEYAAGATPAIIANVGTLVIGASGAYTFTPAENWNGTVPTVTYTTNTGSTSTLDISVTPVNDPSVLTADTNTVDEDHAATGNVLTNDHDVDNLLSVATFTVGGTEYAAGATPAIIANVGTLVIGANGAYTFTPAENWNGTVPTVTYTTNTGSTSTLDISVTPVNDSSVLTADTQTVDEDQAATGNVLGNDSDVDNLLSVATFTVGGTEYTAGVPATIANVGTLVIGANGAYTFTPVENYNGTVPTVTYTTNTGSTSTLDISVTPVNDPSVLGADTQTVDEDHTATGNVLGNDHDVDNLLSVATFTVGGTEYAAGAPATIANVGTLVIGANGAYTFTPVENYNGTVPTVTYTTNTGSTSTLDISVTPVNDPSVLGADTNTVDEDHAATGNVLSNDSDVDNLLSVATFTVGGTEYTAGATSAIIANVGTLVIGASGAYTFTPDSNYNGTVPTVTYTTNTGSTSTLNISVTAVDDPSVLTADTQTVDEDHVATGNVLSNDSDVDNDLSVATFTVGGTEYAAGVPAIIANVGTLVIGANGAYAFTPVENWNGAVPQVTYTTNTGSTSTLDISVTPVNDPSVLTADTNTVDEDQAATGNVLGNDSDVDNLLSVATFTVGGTEYTAGATPAIIANVGSLTLGANGNYTFTPVENWNGTVPTVTYTTNTGSTSTLDISVTPVNDPSVLTADTNTVDEDHAATGNVLTNDHDVDNDLSVATFTVGGTEYTAGVPAIIANVGTLVIGANGAYTFTPAENWNGTVPTVTYTTNTGSTSTLDISVTPVNDPSVLTADTNTVDEDHAATGNVLTNDHDVDNDLSVATFTVGGTEYTAGVPAIIANVGTLVIGANGAYTFTRPRTGTAPCRPSPTPPTPVPPARWISASPRSMTRAS
ncbi:retention module-containing protein [Pseudomonas sp. CLCA07]